MNSTFTLRTHGPACHDFTLPAPEDLPRDAAE